MKFGIAEDSAVKREPIINLVLRRDNNDIDIVATDDNGSEMPLVSFCESGKIFRYGSIDKDFGFDLDKNGKIKITR